MKKFLAFIFVVLLLSGCGKKTTEKKAGSKDTSEVNISPVKNPNQQFVFRYKFVKGKHYAYKLAVFTEENQIIRADTTINDHIKQSLIYNVDISLDKTDKDSVMELTCNIGSIVLDALINGQFYTYRSGAKLDSTDMEKYAQYESLVNNPFNVSINKNGGVLEIFHVDKAVNKFLQIKGAENKANLEQKNKLRENIIEGALMPIVTQLFREMTPKTVARDSTWTYTQPATSLLVFKLNNTNRYKINDLKRIDNDVVAEIDANLHSVISGNTKFEERGAVYNFQKPETSANGTIYFNISQGLLQKSNVKTTLNISYTMEAPTPGGKRKGSKSEKITSTNVVQLL